MADTSKHKDYLTTTEAAKILSVSPDTVLKWVKAGKIESFRTLGGHFRIPSGALDALATEKNDLPILDTTARQISTFQYCWEYLSKGGAIKPECHECITYRSRSRRCYELRDLPEGLGCLRLYCKSSCEDCDYYGIVSGQGINVMVLSEGNRILTDYDEDSNNGIHIRFVTSEYECAMMIEKFRPDYIVVDCTLGKKRTEVLCRSLFNDPRIPVVRLILSSKIKKLSEYCDKEVFGWIKKPFTVRQLMDCIEGTA